MKVVKTLVEEVDDRGNPEATERSVLTTGDLDALPPGSVVDATLAGVRVRAMRREGWGSWGVCVHLDGSWAAMSRDLTDAVLVTSAPITPAPVKTLPLPTAPGVRFWGRTSETEPQWWFLRDLGVGELWYCPARGDSMSTTVAALRGLVRLSDPNTSDTPA